MFLKLSQSEKLRNLYPALEFSKNYLDSAKNNARSSRPEKQFSFLGGNAGVWAISVAQSTVMNETDQKTKYLKEYLKAVSYFKQIDSEDTLLPSELFVGRAGYICGLNWMKEIAKCNVIPENDYLELIECLFQSGKNYAQKNQLNVPLMYNYHDRYLLHFIYFFSVNQISS
jgi:hypothetical protein